MKTEHWTAEQCELINEMLRTTPPYVIKPAIRALMDDMQAFEANLRVTQGESPQVSTNACKE